MNFTTNVKKSAILKTLNDNKVRHRKTLKKAKKAWRDKVRKAQEDLDASMLGTSRTEEDICKALDTLTTLRHQVPDDMSDTYDGAIAMVDAHQGQTLELEESDFRQLMQDQWSWTSRWNDTVSNYMALK